MTICCISLKLRNVTVKTTKFQCLFTEQAGLTTFDKTVLGKRLTKNNEVGKTKRLLISDSKQRRQVMYICCYEYFVPLRIWISVRLS